MAQVNYVPLPKPLALYDGDLTIGSSGAGTANTVYYVGVMLYSPVTLTGMRIHFGAGGNGHYDLGIYSDNNGAPGTLLANCAATTTSLATSSATLTPSFINGNLPLAPGRYWLAFWIDNATDTVTRQSAPSSGMEVVKSQSSVGPLPASASSLSNATFKPILIGLISGGFS